MASGLDDIDHRLLALLQEDDRVPVAELGKALGVAPSTLNDRIRRLIKLGVISGFHARVVQHECDHLDGILYPQRIRDMRLFGFSDVLFPGQALADD